jgi:hypothetical protein
MNKFINWLFSPSLDYTVIKTNDKTGTEVRYNGHSYKLHINDQVRFDAHMKKLLNTIKLPKNE